MDESSPLFAVPRPVSQPFSPPAPRLFHAIGVDVGGTKTAAGIVSFPEAVVHGLRVIPTTPSRGGEAVLSGVLELVDELAREACARGTSPGAVGIGVCELVDLSGAVVSANCIAWKGLPIEKRFLQVAPAVVEADVRAAALAEALFGAGRGFESFLYVTVGTGISCSLVLGGAPHTGARGLTGTMASSPLPRTSEGEGKAEPAPPTLEDLASGPGLVARYNRAAGRSTRSAEGVLQAAAAGDAEAIRVARSGAEALGAAVGIIVSTLDPEAVVVGGGLGLTGGLYWETFTASTRRHIWSEIHRALPILPAAKGREAGVIGAAATAWRKFSAPAQPY